MDTLTVRLVIKYRTSREGRRRGWEGADAILVGVPHAKLAPCRSIVALPRGMVSELKDGAILRGSKPLSLSKTIWRGSETIWLGFDF